jgi:hypothetical protein
MRQMGWDTRDTTARMRELADVGTLRVIPTIEDMATAMERYGVQVRTGSAAMKMLDDQMKELVDRTGPMRAAVRETGLEVDSMSSRITDLLATALKGMPQIFIDAFTGGGGVIGALKGIGVSLLNAIVKEILDPIMERVAAYAVRWALAIAGAFTGGGGFTIPSFGAGGGGAGGVIGGGGGLSAGAIAGGVGTGLVGYIGYQFANDLIAGNTGVEAPSGWINGVYVPPANTVGAAPPELDHFGPQSGYDTHAGYMPYEFAEGTRGRLFDFGAGTTVRLHGKEGVVTEGEVNEQAAMNRELREEIAGLRRDFTFTIPGLIAAQMVVALAKAGIRG